MFTPIAKEIKQQILDKAKQGSSVPALAKEYNVSTKTIYGWLSKQTISKPSIGSFNRLKRERDDLLKLVGELNLELSKQKRGS